MTGKERFVEIFNDKIKREGADKLLEYLLSPQSDFFVAPASARFHGSYAGGLVDHSLNVYDCLVDYLSRPRVKELYGLLPSEESVAIAALLHDLCKINCYKPGTRNVKDENGVWHSVPTFEFSDPLPYGHGEKSVYIASGYMRLTRDEAFAIRYHMGFSGNEDPRTVGDALENYPLAFALSVADMEAS
ncbi:MAG: HD domain-containing protein, partial [Clostridia bacterium]|nr:HD domain-containing protein [Clostridia bacterium]